MGKGDHARSYAHAITRVDYAKKVEQIDWAQASNEPQSRRVCMKCKSDKPFGRWCSTCDTNTDSERVYDEG